MGINFNNNKQFNLNANRLQKAVKQKTVDVSNEKIKKAIQELDPKPTKSNERGAVVGSKFDSEDFAKCEDSRETFTINIEGLDSDTNTSGVRKGKKKKDGDNKTDGDKKTKGNGKSFGENLSDRLKEHKEECDMHPYGEQSGGVVIVVVSLIQAAIDTWL